MSIIDHNLLKGLFRRFIRLIVQAIASVEFLWLAQLSAVAGPGDAFLARDSLAYVILIR